MRNSQLYGILIIMFFASCQPRALKILCLGDSITQGKVVNDSITQLSYRFWLWEKLDSSGYKVDMLGSNSIWFNEKRDHRVNLPLSHYTRHPFDTDHESFYGIRTKEFLIGGFIHDSIKYAPLHDRLQKIDPPDIALIHIGSNDNKSDSLQTIMYLKQIIEQLHARNHRIRIFLAKLNTPWVYFVNNSVQPIASEFSTKYPEMVIVPVDMASGWINNPELPGCMTFDWVHPNILGQKTMADKWFKAIQASRK